jgi:hypothetical protein
LKNAKVVLTKCDGTNMSSFNESLNKLKVTKANSNNDADNEKPIEAHNTAENTVEEQTNLCNNKLNI